MYLGKTRVKIDGAAGCITLTQAAAQHLESGRRISFDEFLERVPTPQDRTRLRAMLTSSHEDGTASGICFPLVFGAMGTRIVRLEPDTASLSPGPGPRAATLRDLTETICPQDPPAGGYGYLTPSEVLDASAFASLGMYAFDCNTGRSRWTQQFHRMIGAPNDIAGPTVEQVVRLIHPEDRERVIVEIQAAIRRIGTYRLEYRLSRPDGSVLEVEDRGATTGPLDPETGIAACAYGVLIDISRQAQLERALKDTEAIMTSLFDNAPFGIAFFDEDFRFVRLNAPMARMNGLPVEAHIGKRPDEILGELEDLDAIYTIWRDLLAGRRSSARVDVSGVTASKHRGRQTWEEHFFSVHRTGGASRIASVAVDVTETKQAQSALEAVERRLRQVLDGTLAFVAVLDAEGRVEEVNAPTLTTGGFKRSEVVGKPFWKTLWWAHDAPESAPVKDAIEQARRGGRARFDLELPQAGAPPTWIDLMVTPVMDAGGQAQFIVASGVDISDRIDSETRINALLHEVNHRSKNMLALVQAIARQTVANSGKDFLDDFATRVRSLASAQDLLVSSDWKDIDLHKVITSQLGYFGALIGDRILIDGPAVLVDANQAQTFAMVLNELATNAAKYGALSNETGVVKVRWRAGLPQVGFEMTWTESGGPAVAQPQRTGFGSTVTKKLIESKLGARVFIDYKPTGLVWRVEVPGLH